MSDDTPTESFTPGESGDLPTRRERRAAEEAAAAKNGQSAAGESTENAPTGDQQSDEQSSGEQSSGEQPTTQLPVAEGTDIFDFGGDDSAEPSIEQADADADQPAAPGPMTQLFTPPSQRGPEPVIEPVSDSELTDSELTDDDASTANEIPGEESVTDDGPATELFAFPGPDAPVPDAVTQRYDQPSDAWPPARTPADDQATRRFDQQPAAFPGADVFDPLFPAGPQAAQPAPPTQVTEAMRRGTPPTEPPQSKRTLIILIVVGAVLLIAVLVLVLLLLTRSIGGGTAASPTPSVMKSSSPSPTPTPSTTPSVTPSPSPTQTTPPAPTNPTFAAFSAQSSAGCSSDSGEVALTFTWGSTDATTAYIGVGTTNAKQDPYASNLPPTDTYTDLTYDCTQASQVYTVTLENAAGLITNRTVTITR